MKIIINKNTPKDTLIYIKDILTGIEKKLKNTNNKDERKKILASLLIISSMISGSAFALNKNNKVDATENNIVELDIPIEIDIPEPTVNVMPSINIEEIVNNNSIETNEEINERNNIVNPTTVDEAIELYSNIFEVDSSITGEIVYYQINENSDDFYNNNILNGVQYENMYEAVFFTILDIVYHPSKYNLNGESIRTYNTFETELTAEELTYIFSEYFNINPFFAMSIEYTECGNDMSSYDWINNNNPAGIGPHNHFRNKATGVIYLCYLLNNTYGIDKESGIDELNNMASTYCTSGTDNWINLTNQMYNQITENGYLYKRRNDDTNFVIDNITYEEYLNQNNSMSI